ncbi:hypothetical protein BDV96DRAFT_653760 [Lophiotrema nucula]|uniref:Uncharacterized protein n=1 Tax=Lophiotrema nucula TaxID=690887 RepID=A0A6A5YL18_9PLEO|nr:hypothetical protein BDV96DRAFT_653760 [Lophiotrema nucula]
MSFGVSAGDLLQIAQFAETTTMLEKSSARLRMSSAACIWHFPTFNETLKILHPPSASQLPNSNATSSECKILVHIGALNLLLSSLSGGVLGKIERKLDDLAADLRQGKRAPTVLSTYEEENADIWEVLKKELLDHGVTAKDIEKHKASIKTYIKTLIDNGALDDVESFESSSTITGATVARQYQATCEEETALSEPQEPDGLQVNVSPRLDKPFDLTYAGDDERIPEITTP